MDHEAPAAQSIKPDWWKHPLPRAIGHDKNFVMTLPQMVVYEAVLAKMNNALEKELSNVSRAIKAINDKRDVSWVRQLAPPQPVTLSRVLTFLIEEGNFHLLLLQTSSQLITSNTRKEHPCTAEDTTAPADTTACATDNVND